MVQSGGQAPAFFLGGDVMLSFVYTNKSKLFNTLKALYTLTLTLAAIWI